MSEKAALSIKYPFTLISQICSSIESGSRPAGGVGYLSEGALSLGGEHIDNKNGHLNLTTPKYVPESFYESAKNGKIQKGDLLLCKDGALTGKVALVRDELDGKHAMVNEHVFVMRSANEHTQKYLFEFLFSTIGQELLKTKVTGAAQGGLNKTNLESIKLPLPPIEIQQQIVSECAAVDEEYNTSRMSIEEYKKKIAKVFADLEVVSSQGGVKRLKLSELCKNIIAGGDKPKNFSETKTETLTIPVYANGVTNNGLFGYTDVATVQEPCVTISARGTLGFAVVHKEPFTPIVRLIAAFPNEDIVDIDYFKYTLDQIQFNNTGGTTPQLTVPNVSNSSVYVPSLEQQKNIVAEVKQYESAIAQARAIMDGCAARKQAILNKYLQ